MNKPHRCHSGARTITLLACAFLAPGCGSNGDSTGTSPSVSGTGGAASGGQSSTSTAISPSGGNGSATGGAGTGGAGSGGRSGTQVGATGGAATGGAATGGAATGGAATGGAQTGGSANSGAQTGGSANSGAQTGGSANSGAQTGGAATGGAKTTGGTSAGTGGARTGGTGAGGGSSSTGGSGGTAAFNPCPATGTCAIMPLGDSITDGVGSSQGGGYRVQLFHDAVQGRQSITFVGSSTPNGPATVDGKTFPRNHEGHPGYTVDNSSTTSGISPLVDASIATNHPNIILLMIGTNDLNRNIDPTNFPTRLGALLDKITNDAPNSLVAVAKITPWQDDGTNVNAVEPFNTKIADVVQTRITSGKHVTLVDMYAPFRANSNYKTALMGDYLHPNDAGYVIMGDVWYNAIKNYLPAAP